MKKLILILMSALITVTSVDAQTFNKRTIKKVAKKEAKALVKEGWKLQETGMLENVIADFLTKKQENNFQEIVGEVRGKKSINMAKSQARNNAINEYAESAKSIVKGRVSSDMNDVAGEEMENFVAAYERLVMKEMNGELMTAYTLVRTNDNKGNLTYDVRLICYIDQDAAHQSHMKAMKQAMEESDLAKKYGSKISEWINDGFEASEKLSK